MVFTSVEGVRVDNMIRVASTEEIIWIDQRFPLRPVLGVKHHRQWDRTLRIQSVVFGKGKYAAIRSSRSELSSLCNADPLTFLTSANNGLVTVYDVSQGSDKLVHLNNLPSALPRIPIVGRKRVGQAVFQHPTDSGDNTALVLQLCDRGSIHRLDVEFTRGDSGSEVGATHDWSQDVLDLEKSTEAAVVNLGQFNERARTEVDMEPMYKSKLYASERPRPRPLTSFAGLYGLDDTPRLSDNPDAFYDTLDAMSDFWHSVETPVEQVLTT